MTDYVISSTIDRQFLPRLQQYSNLFWPYSSNWPMTRRTDERKGKRCYGSRQRPRLRASLPLRFARSLTHSLTHSLTRSLVFFSASSSLASHHSSYPPSLSFSLFTPTRRQLYGYRLLFYIIDDRRFIIPKFLFPDSHVAHTLNRSPTPTRKVLLVLLTRFYTLRRCLLSLYSGRGLTSYSQTIRISTFSIASADYRIRPVPPRVSSTDAFTTITTSR